MTDQSIDPQQALQVLIWAPLGRDAALALQALERGGIPAVISRTLGEACRELAEGRADLAVIAEEALTRDGIEQLKSTLTQQPAWSDIPLILLTGGGISTEASLAHLRRMRVLGNITLLERPLRSVTLVAAVQSALASRKRQLQTRDYIRDLQEVQTSLAHANADLKQFAFAASHDLQEPLRMVNVFTQLLVERHVDPASSEAHQFAEYIRSGVRRMESLLQDVLHYSRAIHEPDLSPAEPFNLTLALQDAVDTLRVEIEAKSAQVQWPPLPEIRGERNQLSLVFQNLLSNSLKYAKPGEPPRIAVHAQTNGEQIEIRMRDNGIGFDQVYAERIFDLFQRLNIGIEAPGTGLGLALCRRIIEKHGGRIWAESSPGAGATLSFTLPVAPKLNE